ncbi:MAG: head-tail connector protein [Holosporales bacterium]|jgi:hypothetical protein|nr:head-tail connector protein [Holosporales bacterium]
MKSITAPTHDELQLVNDLFAMVDYSISNRKKWENKWTEILDHVDPFEDSIFTPTGANLDNAKSTMKGRTYRSALSSDVRTMANILISQLIDPTVKWFTLNMNPEGLYSDYVRSSIIHGELLLKEWMRSLEDLIYNICSDSDSNFYQSSGTAIREWSMLGSAVRSMSAEVLPNGTFKVKFDTVPLKQISFITDGDGQIIFAAREITLNGYQALKKYGTDAIRDELNFDIPSLFRLNKKFYHIIIENNNRKNELEPKYLGYILDVDKRRLLTININGVDTIFQSYDEMPYSLMTFYKNSNELYGRSPLWYLLDEIKYLDDLVDLSKKQIEYAVRPMMAAAPDFKPPIGGFSPGRILLGGLDYDKRLALQPIPLGSVVNLSEQIFAIKRQDISKGLLVHDMFSPENPNMSATEVMERKIANDNIIKPIITRWEREDLARVIKFMLKKLVKIVKPFPYDMLGINPVDFPDPISQLNVKYNGILGRQQKRYDDMMVDKMINDISVISQLPENTSEIVNEEEVIKFKANCYDLPNLILRSPDETAQIRAAKAADANNQLQQQLIMQNLKSMGELNSAAMKKPLT